MNTEVKLFLNREQLLSAYLAKASREDFKKVKDNCNIEKLLILEPALCAKIRDTSTYEKVAFSELLDDFNSSCIKVGEHFLTWIYPPNSSPFLNAVGLESFLLKAPCTKRKNFVESNLAKLKSIFPNELKFIGDFTSTICWLEAKENKSIGSAGFYEIPHCTFFSDAAMFSLPPENIIPKIYCEYAIFENLYHEALHHQMHAFAALSAGEYLIENSCSIPKFTISWRDRNFTLLEAFHALHVYIFVAPLRLKYLNNKKNILSKNTLEFHFLTKAYGDALRMFQDLFEAFQPYIDLFKPNWKKLIYSWLQNHKIFKSFSRMKVKHNGSNLQKPEPQSCPNLQ